MFCCIWYYCFLVGGGSGVFLGVLVWVVLEGLVSGWDSSRCCCVLSGVGKVYWRGACLDGVDLRMCVCLGWNGGDGE